MILQGRLLVDPHLAPPPGWLRIAGGAIAEIGEGDPPERADAGGPDRLITPGFIDAHLHLPQIDSVGCDGLDLLRWLDEVVYPAEGRWADPSFADAQAWSAYRRLIRCGTLGFAGHLTSHRHALVAAVRAGHRLPLRSIVGQVLMDRNAPEPLLGHDLARLARSERGRLDTSVNPRFAVACSEALLERARSRAEGGAFIQTHLAETARECALVRELFPVDPHYTAVYDRHSLLTRRTLLAHGVHLAPEEWSLVARRGAVVVHCPAANTFLASGLFDLGAAREHNVRLALGSDVAAGADLAMPRVARAMIEVAKMRGLRGDGPACVPTPAEAWELITRSNADALGWTTAGRLEVGGDADLLVLRPPVEIDRHLIGRLIYTWRDDLIEHAVLGGRLIELGRNPASYD